MGVLAFAIGNLSIYSVQDAFAAASRAILREREENLRKWAPESPLIDLVTVDGENMFFKEGEEGFRKTILARGIPQETQIYTALGYYIEMLMDARGVTTYPPIVPGELPVRAAA